MALFLELRNELEDQMPYDTQHKIAILRNIANQDVFGTDTDGNTQLHLVLYKLKLTENIVKELLDLGAPVNATNSDGYTPLHYALIFRNCNLPIVKLLVDRGADVSKSDPAGFGPLHSAVTNFDCSTDVIDFLCAKGADVKCVDEAGNTLLHHASEWKLTPLENVQLLIEKGVNPHARNMHGETALHVAVRSNHKDVVKLLLRLPKIKVNLSNSERLTPLHLSVSDPNTDPGIVKLLLDAGASVDKKSEKDRQSLHLAAYNCNPAHIKLLLDYGARVNVRDKEKMSPLYIAANRCQRYDRTSLKLLLDHGALIFHDKPRKKVNPQDKCPLNASTALHEAARVLGIEKRSKGPGKTHQVLLLLKYTLLENPRMCFQKMEVDCETKHMLKDYMEKCIAELSTVCLEPKVTLAQFILQSSLQPEGSETPTNDILEILSARSYPIYKEVVAGLMDRDDLKDGLQRHPVYAFNEKSPDDKAVLDYDTLSVVMVYLADYDLLNLLLAVFQPKRRPVPQVKRCCPCSWYEEIEAESEKFHKRAREV